MSPSGETLLRLRAAIEKAGRALDAIEQGDELARRRGGRALREAFARVELVREELQEGGGGGLSDDEARELAALVDELVRVTKRAQAAGQDGG